MKKVLFGLVLVIGAMIAFTACTQSDGPSKAVDAYYTAVVAGDYAEAFKHCCNSEGAVLSADQQKTFADNLAARDTADNKITEFSILSETVKEDKANGVVVVEVTKKNGEKNNVTEECVKVGEEWYMKAKK